MNRSYPLAAHCPDCGKPMRLIRTIQRCARFPELQAFVCKTCDAAVTEVFQPEIFELAVRWFEEPHGLRLDQPDFHGIRLLAGTMGRSHFRQ